MIIEVWSAQEDDEDRIYGRVRGTIRQILKDEDKTYDIIKKQGYAYGTITFKKFELYGNPSMPEYIKDGWKISLMSAIDFTASNTDPCFPSSLHYINPANPYELSPYEKALKDVGTVLEPYDSDKKFSMYGFGAVPKFLGTHSTSHCFSLSGEDEASVDGVKGALEAYRNVVNSIMLSGPTTFEPCLRKMIDMEKDSKTYHILLYLTDGDIHDMQETINA